MALGEGLSKDGVRDERIVGIEVTAKIILPLRWWSLRLPDSYGGCLAIGPLRLWVNLARAWNWPS